MTLEEVARQRRMLRGSPDNSVFRKMFKVEYFVNEKVFLAESSNDASGVHGTRRVRTMKLAAERFFL